jgi:pimeloyl-ACP methyl ester carboxylesterase
MSITVKSSSPLKLLPEDYCPAGSEQWFRIPEGNDSCKLLFYSDYSITGESEVSTVLFVHGNPECSYTFRYVRDALIEEGAPLRLVSVDHIGFGISDQASFEMVDMHHAENLSQLIRHLDLQNVTLVVHDWGGPIGVGAFLGQMDRVCSLIVLNSTIFPMPPDGYTYANWPLRWIPWCTFPTITPDSLWGGLAGYIVLNSNPAPIALSFVRSYIFQLRFALGRIPLNTPGYVFSESLRSKQNARSSKRNVLQTPKWGYGYSYEDPTLGHQDNHNFYRAIQEQVRSSWGPDGRTIPAAGHFGEYDPCGKASVVQQWQEALHMMSSNTHVYASAGHFIEEHKGPEIAASILAVNGLGS